MNDLGPCPMCGRDVSLDMDYEYVVCDCGFFSWLYDTQHEMYDRLSAMGELWRLLEWAGKKKLFIVPRDGTRDAFVWQEVPSSDDRPQLTIVAWADNTLDALREARELYIEKVRTEND